MSDQHLQRSPAAAPVEVSLPRRFEALAAAQPRAPLVVYGEWRLSYRDVNGAANRLAHRLMALGVARNVPVGLCLDRGPDLLVAILAVQKAGGAFVPLDPHWPVDRLGRMWAAASAASRPAVLVTRTALLKHLPEHAGPVLDLDRDQSAVAAESSENPAVRLDPHQWCYVLFTSGSTGVPKGVPVTHGNLAGLFPPLNAALEFGPDDIWTWFHSASFGFSVWELWGALLHGGCLVIVPEHIRQDPVALGELLVDEQVTVFSQTPSAYRRVLHEARFHASVAASRLRYLALSGEALRREDIAGWLARGHRARLLNTYAITETAGQLTLRVYGEGDATEESARNLGQPLEGREVLVLDAGGQPVPRGTAGELWVGGEGVTPGYLSAPDLASRFSELPVPGAGVVRGYLTDDRVRQLPDASLEYLGRVDAQLKFRGYRIEPGDIETALRDHPGVRDAAVALQTDATGNQRLTAWLVAGDASASPEPRAGTAEFWPSLGAYGVYDQWLYGLMNAEPERLAAYRAAFAAAVPGKVVLDIGTGEDAVLARLCIEAGATHVYAVEVLESAAQRATELVRSLGLQDRITVIPGDIAAIDLPQRVDVCTQGIIGNIGSADGIAGIWNAARRHFAPGCVAVPERCVTRIAALELPAAVRAQPRFGALAADYARRLLATVGQPFDLRLCLRNVAGTDLLTAAADFERPAPSSPSPGTVSSTGACCGPSSPPAPGRRWITSASSARGCLCICRWPTTRCRCAGATGCICGGSAASTPTRGFPTTASRHGWSDRELPLNSRTPAAIGAQRPAAPGFTGSCWRSSTPLRSHRRSPSCGPGWTAGCPSTSFPRAGFSWPRCPWGSVASWIGMPCLRPAPRDPGSRVSGWPRARPWSTTWLDCGRRSSASSPSAWRTTSSTWAATRLRRSR